MENVTDLGELFERVQMENVFPDGKTFVDCIPKGSIASIRSRYDLAKSDPGFSLASFVHDNFQIPEQADSEYKNVAGRPIQEHLDLLWDELTRVATDNGGSLIGLPHSYVVPGGRFREMFYWDSYFTMLGLAISKRSDLIQGMIDNFSFLIDQFGYIPNGNRSYFIGRSQPPFFASMLRLLVECNGNDETILVKYLPQLQTEYAFWMRGADELGPGFKAVNRVVLLPDGSILNRYWDESDLPRPESYKEDMELALSVTDKKVLFRNLRAACESGWDFSSRWFKEESVFTSIHTTDIIPVDLNCLLYNLELTIADALRISGDLDTHQHFTKVAELRKEAINTYCWDNINEFYFDYDFTLQQLKPEWTLAAAYPLFFGVASNAKAEQVVAHVKKHFLSGGGVRTTTKVTGQQWDSPNGWAPLQWIVVNGLKNYGFIDEARDIANRWMSLNEKVYGNTGKMMEKYNVVSTDLAAGGGEYLSQDGFGWTNGVYLALKKLFP